MQYLYMYPSPEGFKAILDLAVNLNNENLRKKLICNLCDSLDKRDEWYS